MRWALTLPPFRPPLRPACSSGLSGSCGVSSTASSTMAAARRLRSDGFLDRLAMAQSVASESGSSNRPSRVPPGSQERPSKRRAGSMSSAPASLTSVSTRAVLASLDLANGGAMQGGADCGLFLRETDLSAALGEIAAEPFREAHHASSRCAWRAGHKDCDSPPLILSRPHFSRAATARFTASGSSNSRASSGRVRATGSPARRRAKIARWTAKLRRDSPRLGSGCIGRFRLSVPGARAFHRRGRHFVWVEANLARDQRRVGLFPK